MHESVDQFVGECVEKYGLARKSVLEVGSRDLNGSIRHHFHGDYLGIDIWPGEGVDYVIPDGDLKQLPARFPHCYGVVVCSETLEHARQPWKLCEDMVDRIGCSAGGYLIVTTRGNGFPDHAVPHDQHGAGGDYWRFMPGALTMLFTDLGLWVLEEREDSQAPGVFLVARK